MTLTAKQPFRRLCEIALGRYADDRRFLLPQQFYVLRPRRLVGRQAQQDEVRLARLFAAEDCACSSIVIRARLPARRVDQIDGHAAEIEPLQR